MEWGDEMSESKEKGFPSWFWYLELTKIIVLLGSRYGLGLSWGMSILITFIVAALLIFGFVCWMKRKAKDED